jgi:hypothetical protein
MPPDSGAAVGTPVTVDAPPELAGWAGAATAVHAVQQMPMPVTLRLHVDGYGTITIDPAFNVYEWSRSLSEFSLTPDSVRVETEPGLPDVPSVELPGRPLDPLLYAIGWRAFGDDPAAWLVDGHRYRLRRWPSLSELAIGLDEVRMIAMLGNAFATADELAAAAQIPPSDARRGVNALSVAGILRRTATAPALDAAAGSREAPPASTGLFARLRQKWGR